MADVASPENLHDWGIALCKVCNAPLRFRVRDEEATEVKATCPHFATPTQQEETP